MRRTCDELHLPRRGVRSLLRPLALRFHQLTGLGEPTEVVTSESSAIRKLRSGTPGGTCPWAFASFPLQAPGKPETKCIYMPRRSRAARTVLAMSMAMVSPARNIADASIGHGGGYPVECGWTREAAGDERPEPTDHSRRRKDGRQALHPGPALHGLRSRILPGIGNDGGRDFEGIPVPGEGRFSGGVRVFRQHSRKDRCT